MLAVAKKRNNDHEDDNVVQLLPHSGELEAAVLGLLMRYPDKLPILKANLQREDFYSSQHRRIYDAALALESMGLQPDFNLLKDYLKADVIGDSNGLEMAGGTPYLAELSISDCLPALLPSYCERLRDYGLRRRTYALSRRMIEELGQAESAKVYLQQQIASLQALAKDTTRTPTSAGWIAGELYAQLERRYAGEEDVGLKTGFTDLDALLVGLRPGDLVYVGARPGMGKTMLALNIAVNVAKGLKHTKSTPVIVFSLEMPKLRLMERLFAREAEVAAQLLRTGKLATEWVALSQAVGTISELPLDIYEVGDGCTSVGQVKAVLHQRVADGQRPGLIVVDYLQLLNADGRRSDQPRAFEVQEISRSLKLMALEYEVPIICLSQLSRAVEARQDKRPELGDLRESGSIEQDADMVLLMFREDYYFPTSPKKGLCEVIVAKNRDGENGSLLLSYRPEIQAFFDSEKKIWDFAEEPPEPKARGKRKGKEHYGTKEDNE